MCSPRAPRSSRSVARPRACPRRSAFRASTTTASRAGQSRRTGKCVMFTLRLAALALLCAPALGAGPNLGQPLTHGDLAAWEIHVLPDGKGLPPGSGTMAQGAPIFAQRSEEHTSELQSHSFISYA